MTQPLDLPWGSQEVLSLNLPTGWEMTDRLEPASKSGVSDPCVETQRALSHMAAALTLSFNLFSAPNYTARGSEAAS